MLLSDEHSPYTSKNTSLPEEHSIPLFRGLTRDLLRAKSPLKQAPCILITTARATSTGGLAILGGGLAGSGLDTNNQRLALGLPKSSLTETSRLGICDYYPQYSSKVLENFLGSNLNLLPETGRCCGQRELRETQYWRKAAGRIVFALELTRRSTA